MGSETWTKQFPAADGYYWVRQSPNTPYLMEVTDAFAAFFGVERMAARRAFKPDHEFLGPITPEQFIDCNDLRESAEWALAYLETRDTTEETRETIIERLRAALHPQPEERK